MKVNADPLSIDDVRERMADNLRALRKERGFSQERLALEASVDRTMLSKIERRIANPSIETLLKLANRLAVDLRELLAPSLRTGTSLDGGSYRADRRGLSGQPIVVQQTSRNLR